MAFIDSPMATSVTEVFRDHPELYDEEMTERTNNHHSFFDFPGLTTVRSTQQSKAINHIKGSVIVIAGSGMCTGGRIKHHLVQNIQRPESTVLFVGYQAAGTLGRIIQQGTNPVRILGREFDVKAKIAKIPGFSAHGDRDEIHRWLSGLQSPPKHLFVTHGEPEAAHSFARFINETNGWSTSVPDYGAAVTLD